ncbi:MAG: ribonuclease III [Lachnospiraceae bacterium]|jgi:ribonuclease-3 family protein|nr:ribonuclease III [Lachnospiraceae bacterium]
MDEGLKAAMPDIRTYSPLTLAFIGDAVFGLYIRTMVVQRGNAAPGKLHEECSRLVKAKTQARMIRGILEALSEEETSVYRRGRNAQAPSRAKHATMSEYRHATGLEALFGYLYLTGQEERMRELVSLCLEAYEREKTEDKSVETEGTTAGEERL